MWPKKYKDYPEDTPLKKEQINSGKGITEMHELNGWGLSDHKYRRKKGAIVQFFLGFFGGEK